MKQITILNGKAMIVELPEGANRFTVFNDDCPYLSFFVSTETPRVYLPPGNWRIIGMLSEVTEEQVAGLVESDTQYGPVMYRNYKTTSMPYYDEQISPLESLESAIEGAGYYLDNNPIPPFHERKDDWLMAQERVLDRSRCLLLGREI